MSELPHHSAVRLLGDWLVDLDDWWNPLGWFGSGYNHWGVQTSLKYAAAAAVVARRHPNPELRTFALERSVATFRQSFDSHVSGNGRCADGSRWGHTWISALAVERALHGLALIHDALPDADRAAFHRVLASEADWLSTSYHRGPVAGIQARIWGDSGKNDPESNLWNGALLWRAATMLADSPLVDEAQRDRYRNRSLEFLAAGVSIAADATSLESFDGRRLTDLHRGPNFFDSFSLDHHSYLNLGYMAICSSQAALLHFDQVAAGLPVPELLQLHQAELWERLRSCITPDGRLIRIGGDSRVRYAYCQEFVPHSAMYASAVLGDRSAVDLVRAHLALVEQERQWSIDRGGTGFYGARMSELRTERPYYQLRLESDRAAALSFVATYGQDLDWTTNPEPGGGAEWSDSQHGFAMVRGDRRLASWCWRAFTGTQGLCVPVSRGDMAEYHLNLSPVVDLEGQSSTFVHPVLPGKPSRTVGRHWLTTFPGGFATVGEVDEGTELTMAEGWKGGHAATSVLAMVALPDDATVIVVQRVVTGSWWVGVREAWGVNLQIPNDVANDGRRRLRSARDHQVLNAVAAHRQTAPLGRWVVIDDVLGVGTLNDRDLFLHRDPDHGGGPHHSLQVETIGQSALSNGHYQAPGTVVIDSSFLLRIGRGDDLAEFGRHLAEVQTIILTDDLRVWQVGRWLVAINLGETLATIEFPRSSVDLTTGARVTTARVPGGQAAVFDSAEHGSMAG